MIPIDATTYRTATAYNKRVRFLVLHYTAIDFATSIRALTRGASSAHYLIPDPDDASYRAAGHCQPVIFNLVDEADRAWHAGVSQWAGRSNLNDSAIGIEIVNLARDEGGVFTFPDYHPWQIDALKQLALDILARYPDITPRQVVGHSDVSPGRKSDPGARFPWRTLYEAGVGAWFDEGTRAAYADRFHNQGLPPRDAVIRAFMQYGYGVEGTLDERAFSALVRAFQLHFRSERYDGVLDVETCARLYALNEKYG
ncbi:N-acetylmuramoyl-L-alanine amidase [Pseudomonas japonica]|uniref:N-acetylmuramoyl-L-alanine amidase n=1 Tax=Pseudomonas japonica TaxID=256466 RepID=UPI0037FC4F48